MRHLKFFILILLLSVVVACNWSNRSENQYVVGFSQCESDNAWRQVMNRELIMEVAQNPDLSLLMEDGEKNNENQIQDIYKLINQGVDILIISPNEAEALVPVVEFAYDKGIPVILLDRKVNTKKYTTYIGASNYAIGKAAGKLARKILPNGGSVLELWGSRLSSPAQERHNGFVDQIKNTSIQIVAEVDGYWVRDSIWTRLPNTIKEIERIDLVYGHNDQMTLEAYKNMVSLGRTDSVQFLGIDGLNTPGEGMDGVLSGKLKATFIYPTGAANAVQQATKILKSQSVQKNIELNTVQVDQQNIKLLKDQADEMKRQLDRIEVQRFTISENSQQIRTQRIVLALVFSTLLLVAILAITILKGKQKIGKQNRKLALQAFELKKHQREIEQQAEELRSTNQNLELQAKTILKQNENIMASINYAKTIQQSMLPLQQNMNNAFRNFIIYLPKDIVSGDFYWFYNTNSQTPVPEKQKLVYAVIDCTGHGVPGAFMSMIGNRVLSNIVAERGEFRPNEILELMDRNVIATLKQNQTMNNDGMDVALCVITPQDNGQFLVEYAGAKRPIFVYHSNEKELKSYKGTRRSIGGKHGQINKIRFESNSLLLHKNDILYLTTDGYSDQCGAQRRRMGRKNFTKRIEENVELPLEQQQENLLKHFRQHMDDQKQRDDVTVLGIQL